MKFLILSDSPFLPTGFRNQSFLLVEHLLADNHEVFWLAPSHVGAPIKNAILPDGRKCNFTVLPGAGEHPHALHVLPHYLNAIRPDIFYCLLDSFMLFPQILNMSLPVPSTLWFPSDGGFFPANCELVLQKFNRPVAMSKWAKDQIKRQFNIDTKCVPHGCKPSLFRPLSDEQRMVLRAQYSARSRFDLRKKFIVGCVARNQPRKFMDRLIKSFALFAKNKNDVLLLLHSDPNDPAQQQAGFLVTELIKRAKIENKIEWSGVSAMTGFPDDKMYEIYNLFNVKLDTTSGEGFGITLIEAMSCEIPVIVTDYTTTREIVLDNKAGLGIRVAGEPEGLYDGKAENLEGLNTITGGWYTERAACDCKHAAELLEQCYQDWKTNDSKLLKEMGKNGRKAVLRDYDFDSVVWPMWRKIFQEMLE